MKLCPHWLAPRHRPHLPCEKVRLVGKHGRVDEIPAALDRIECYLLSHECAVSEEHLENLWLPLIGNIGPVALLVFEVDPNQSFTENMVRDHDTELLLKSRQQVIDRQIRRHGTKRLLIHPCLELGIFFLQHVQLAPSLVGWKQHPVVCLQLSLVRAHALMTEASDLLEEVMHERHLLPLRSVFVELLGVLPHLQDLALPVDAVVEASAEDRIVVHVVAQPPLVVDALPLGRHAPSRIGGNREGAAAADGEETPQPHRTEPQQSICTYSRSH